MKSNKLISFDWAIKKLLRNKANFAILEGFLTELLKFEVKVDSILEGEGNQEEERSKYNRVDILIRSQNGELMLVEVQNESQVDYFQRMIFGVSKLVTEYISKGEPYSAIKKVYSINIVYFGLGQGTDYVYEYNGQFIGSHNHDVLYPSKYQKDKFGVAEVKDIFPKYYLLKVNNFNDVAKDSLDEWIYFLKNSEVKEGFGAKGLELVKEKLREGALSEEERRSYQRFQENRRLEQSVIETAEIEAKERGKEIGREEGLALAMSILKKLKEGKTVEQIALELNISEEKISKLIENLS